MPSELNFRANIYAFKLLGVERILSVSAVGSLKEEIEPLDIVLPDLPYQAGDEVVVLVSGVGATPVMELYILYDEVEKLLAERGIRVYRPYVGNYFTSLDMMGVTLTLMKVDAELKVLVDLEVESMGLTQFGSQP